jgi:hypothetical protein
MRICELNLYPHFTRVCGLQIPQRRSIRNCSSTHPYFLYSFYIKTIYIIGCLVHWINCLVIFSFKTLKLLKILFFSNFVDFWETKISHFQKLRISNHCFHNESFSFTGSSCTTEYWNFCLYFLVLLYSKVRRQTPLNIPVFACF